MKRVFELKQEEILEAIALYVSLRAGFELPIHVELRINGRTPEPDPPYAPEKLVVLAVATKEGT